MMRTRQLIGGLAIILLGACSSATGPDGINDPYEARNREVHGANVGLDRGLVRPVSQGYGKTLPEPVRRGVGNFASNLSLPGIVVNDLLQFRLEDALNNSARFLLNSTVGLAGVLDPASAVGVEKRSTDFGETLHVWGAQEGAYVELPLLGPSTTRDAIGKVVDTVMDPLSLAIPRPERFIGTAASVADKVGDRYQYSDFVDSILYESADSYAQARLLYLQNRRFELRRGEEPDYVDPYEDLYAQ